MGIADHGHHALIDIDASYDADLSMPTVGSITDSQGGTWTPFSGTKDANVDVVRGVPAVVFYEHIGDVDDVRLTRNTAFTQGTDRNDHAALVCLSMLRDTANELDGNPDSYFRLGGMDLYTVTINRTRRLRWGASTVLDGTGGKPDIRLPHGPVVIACRSDGTNVRMNINGRVWQWAGTLDGAAQTSGVLGANTGGGDIGPYFQFFGAALWPDAASCPDATMDASVADWMAAKGIEDNWAASDRDVLVCMGDSLWDADDGPHGVMGSRTGKLGNTTLVNHSYPGQRLESWIATFSGLEEAVGLIAAGAARKTALIGAGINDITASGATVARTRLDTLVALCRGAGYTKIIVMTVPLNCQNAGVLAASRAYNDGLRASSPGDVLLDWRDIYPAFDDDATPVNGGSGDGLRADHVHPKNEVYVALAPLLIEQIKLILSLPRKSKDFDYGTGLATQING